MTFNAAVYQHAVIDMVMGARNFVDQFLCVEGVVGVGFRIGNLI